MLPRQDYTFKDWRDKNYLKYPPYIAYLALFLSLRPIRAMRKSFSENSYYKRLRELLNEQTAGNQNYPSFNKNV